MSSLLAYFGGKTYMMDDIIPIIANVINKCSFFVDVFGGSGRVIISLPKEWQVQRIYNDLDKRMFTIIKWFQSEEAQPILNTPAIIPHADVFADLKNKKNRSPLEEFYLMFHSFNGMGRDMKRLYTQERTSFDTSRYRRMHCENMDFRKLVDKYDSLRTFFYFDPPYLQEQDYKHSFNKNDFTDLRDLLKNIKGFWLMNHTKDTWFDQVFGTAKFYKDYTNLSSFAQSETGGSIRTEGFWMSDNLK